MTELAIMMLRVMFSRPLRNWSARIQSEANLREHWGAKSDRRKRQRRIVAEAWKRDARLLGLRPRLPALVVLSRIAPRPFDSDNLTRAFKAVRDEIAEQLGADDADPRIKWRYEQRRGSPNQVGILIEVAWHASGSRWVGWDQAPGLEVVRPVLEQGELSLVSSTG